MMMERSTWMFCSFWKRESTAKVPSTPWPLPPSVAWASRRMKSSPFSAACTAAASPERPPPTMTMLVSMTSTTSSGFTSMPELLMGSDERLPVVAKSVDAEPLVCGAQPARPAAAALAAPRVPKARKLLRDRFSIVFSSICFGILCDCYAEKPLEAS